jgi:hypothetical protein
MLPICGQIVYHPPMKTGRLLLEATITLGVSIAAAGQHVHSQPTQVAGQHRRTDEGSHRPAASVTAGPLFAVSPDAIVQQVYEFAARHPEVLQRIPCYCGCERVGHNGNHDCFVKTRKANGTVTEWDPQGIGCAICLDVGRDAISLFNAGTSLQ